MVAAMTDMNNRCPLTSYVLIGFSQGAVIVDYLRAKGWDVEGTVRTDLFRRNGLPVPAPHDDDPLGEIIFISGRLNG